MIDRLMPIVRNEFIHLFRDPRTLLMMFFMPIFLLFIFGYAASMDVDRIPLAVLDQDKTPISRDFIQKFTSNKYFIFREQLETSAQFSDRLDSGKIKVILNIAANFSENIAAGKKADVQALVDGTDPTWASSALSYISAIGETCNLNLQIRSFSAGSGRKIPREPIKLETRVWYNENLLSANFFIPGLICVILMQMAGTLTSLSIVSEKEQGTIEGLVVSPVRKNELMIGKILPYVIVAFCDVLLVTAVGYFWFGVPVKGSFLLLAVSSILFLVGAMGLGIFISIIAKTGQEAIQVALLVTMLPSILLSGFVFPLENMPWPLQALSCFMPARYYLKILRGVFLKGIGWSYLWWDLFLLLVFAVFILAASSRKFKKRIE